MYSVGAFQKLTIWKLYRVNFYYIDILKLRTYEWLYSYVQKHLLILRLSLLYCALYKPSELVVWVKTDFNSMLNLGLSFIRVVGAYKIHTEFFPLENLQNYHWFYLTLYINLCILLTSWLDGVIFIHDNSYRVFTIIGDA